MSERPSAVTSSLASTVPKPGHQFTGISAEYTSRWSSMIPRRSPSLSSPQARPSGVARSPDSNEATSSAIGRATSASGSNHDSKICVKIHWVQR